MTITRSFPRAASEFDLGDEVTASVRIYQRASRAPYAPVSVTARIVNTNGVEAFNTDTMLGAGRKSAPEQTLIRAADIPATRAHGKRKSPLRTVRPS